MLRSQQPITLALLGFLLCLSAPISADQPEREKSAQLVFKYAKSAQSVNGTEYPILIFAHAESGEEIHLKRKKGLQFIKVAPGTYYLRRIQTAQFGFSSAAMPVPTDASRLMELPEDGLAYIGDLSWSNQTGLRLGFTKRSLLALQKDRKLHSSTLFLTGFGKPPQSVSWN